MAWSLPQTASGGTPANHARTNLRNFSPNVRQTPARRVFMTVNKKASPAETQQRKGGREQKGLRTMTTKNTAKSIVAAALVAALATGATAAPAFAAEAAAPAPEAPNAAVALVAQSVSSDYAIDAAVDASPLYWYEVSSYDFYYDACTDDYVVNLYSVYGEWYTVWVDATTGAAWQIA